MLSDLPTRIRQGQVVVCVLGLRRVGLPLSIVLARSGLKVIGVDLDEEKVSTIGRGIMPFHYPAMEGWLKEALAGGESNHLRWRETRPICRETSLTMRIA